MLGLCKEANNRFKHKLIKQRSKGKWFPISGAPWWDAFELHRPLGKDREILAKLRMNRGKRYPDLWLTVIVRRQWLQIAYLCFSMWQNLKRRLPTYVSLVLDTVPEKFKSVQSGSEPGSCSTGRTYRKWFNSVLRWLWRPWLCHRGIQGKRAIEQSVISCTLRSETSQGIS